MRGGVASPASATPSRSASSSGPGPGSSSGGFSLWRHKRERARYFINQNFSLDHWDDQTGLAHDRKKRPKMGFEIGDEKELIDQGRRGGLRWALLRQVLARDPGGHRGGQAALVPQLPPVARRGGGLPSPLPRLWRLEDVEAIACGLCGDPPACKTECCGGYLCSACMESRERARAEFMASTALVRPWNPSLCYFCGRGPEASVPVAGVK